MELRDSLQLQCVIIFKYGISFEPLSSTSWVDRHMPPSDFFVGNLIPNNFYLKHFFCCNRSSDVDIRFFFHIDTYRYFGDSYWYYRYDIDIIDIISIFFLFLWILRPLQNTYFYVKSIVGFLKNANFYIFFLLFSIIRVQFIRY